jgi:hypothetical protein
MQSSPLSPFGSPEPPSPASSSSSADDTDLDLTNLYLDPTTGLPGLDLTGLDLATGFDHFGLAPTTDTQPWVLPV